MYYLVIETMGRKRCIDISEENIYASEQYYDCQSFHLFDETNKNKLSEIRIHCTASPTTDRAAEVWGDKRRIHRRL
jgi:hypothetical protein